MAFTYEGSVMRVNVDGKTIMHEVDFSYGETTEFQEIATKDVENDVSPGKTTYSLSGNGYAENSEGGAQEDIASLFAWRAAKSSKPLTITDGVVGHIQIAGNAYLETVEIQSTVDEVVTYSWTMKVTTATVSVVPEA